MQYRDEFDDHNEDPNVTQRVGALRRELFLRTRGPALAGGVLIAAAFILAAVIFFTYPSSPDDQEPVPIIQADARPFKIVPDEPGGMQIPHRDSTVFSSLRGVAENPDKKVENLLEDNTEEEPLPRSQLFAGLNMEADTVSEPAPRPNQSELSAIEPAASSQYETSIQIQERPAQNIDLFPDVQTPEPVQLEPQTLSQPSTQAEPERAAITSSISSNAPDKITTESVLSQTPKTSASIPQEKPQPAQELAALNAAPKPSAVVPSASSDTHFVQIGAVRSMDAARKGWDSYQKQYGSTLSGLDHRVQRADLGAKGIYYRIQAGPISKAKANDICSDIKKLAGGCIVVAR